MSIWSIIVATMMMVAGTRAPAAHARQSHLAPFVGRMTKDSSAAGRFETLEVQDGGYIVRTYSVDQSAHVALSRSVRVKDAVVRVPTLDGGVNLPIVNAAVQSPDGRRIATIVTYRNLEHRMADVVHIIDISSGTVVHEIIPSNTSDEGVVVPTPKDYYLDVDNCEWLTSERLRIIVRNANEMDTRDKRWYRADTVNLTVSGMHITYGRHTAADTPEPPNRYSRLAERAASWFAALDLHHPLSMGQDPSPLTFGRYRGAESGAVSADGNYAIMSTTGTHDFHGVFVYYELVCSGKPAAMVMDVDPSNTAELALVPHALVAVMYQGLPIPVNRSSSGGPERPVHHHVDVWSLEKHKFAAQRLPGDLLVDTASAGGK